MHEPTKDVTLGNARYQLGRLSALEGNWVISQFMLHGLLAKIAGNDAEVDERQVGLLVSVAMPEFPEDVLARIQRKCFGVCKLYVPQADTEVPHPLFRADGRWNVAEPDGPTAMALLTAALAFNLAPFFAPAALAMLRQMLPPDLSQSSAAT